MSMLALALTLSIAAPAGPAMPQPASPASQPTRFVPTMDNEKIERCAGLALADAEVAYNDANRKAVQYWVSRETFIAWSKGMKSREINAHLSALQGEGAALLGAGGDPSEKTGCWGEAAAAFRPATGALAQESAASTKVVTHPDWLELPSSAEIAKYYPPSAALLGLEGRATLDCRVTIAGKAADCLVVSENPPEMGFGEAALATSRAFRFKPRTIDGKADDEGRIQVPVNFAAWAPSPDDLRLASRCAGWGQATYAAMTRPIPAEAEWAYVYWRFKFTLNAIGAGQSPSKIVARLDQAAAAAGPRRLRSADEYVACRGEEAQIAPPAIVIPVLPSDITRAENCAGLAAALAETANPQTAAIRQRYVTWTSIFTTDGVRHGLKPREIDDRLERARLAAQAKLGQGDDAVQACDRASRRRNPLALPPRVESPTS